MRLSKRHPAHIVFHDEVARDDAVLDFGGIGDVLRGRCFCPDGRVIDLVVTLDLDELHLVLGRPHEEVGVVVPHYVGHRVNVLNGKPRLPAGEHSGEVDLVYVAVGVDELVEELLLGLRVEAVSVGVETLDLEVIISRVLHLGDEFR